MRVLGLDVGTKTIGVALSDETGLIASPHETLGRRGTRADVAALFALAQRFGVSQVVVGLPLELDGTPGPAARRVQTLVDALRAAGLEVALQDERFSTVAAERALLEADLSRARRKQVVDKVAAAYILQGWLDAHRPAREDSEP
ncbi:MAG TPA: Holliday junction resolvase RuvX [Polyangia bacterium]|nr:Holliday junction resolvase RuvX [Polyangia bacterium]